MRSTQCPSFTDIDECADGSHDCHSTAYCINTAGTYYCACKQSGYSYNGSMCIGVCYSCSFVSTPLCDLSITIFRQNIVRLAVKPHTTSSTTKFIVNNRAHEKN